MEKVTWFNLPKFVVDALVKIQELEAKIEDLEERVELLENPD